MKPYFFSLFVLSLFSSSAGGLADYFKNLPRACDPQVISQRITDQFLRANPVDYRPVGYNAERGYGSNSYVSYPVVSLWVNALACAHLSGDKVREEKLIRHFDAFLPGGRLRHCRSNCYHVDDSVFGALPLEVYLRNGDDRCLKLGLHYADIQWTPPCPETIKERHAAPKDVQVRYWDHGYTPQTRLWIDDMYMITVLQSQAYRATGDRKYIDRAANEMCFYLDELQLKDGSSKGLFYHAPDAPHIWGRGDGWMAAGMALVLDRVPVDNPNRDRILRGYRLMMETLLKYQRPDGLWCQLVNRPDESRNWPESSCSAMFAYAFMTGVKRGWLDGAVYGPAARKAYVALCGLLDEHANVPKVCEGTGKEDNEMHYFNRKRVNGDPHGQAPMLWMTSELLQAGVTSACEYQAKLVPYPQKLVWGSGARAVSCADIKAAMKGFRRCEKIPSEGYRLKVSKTGVEISASNEAGAFYAGETLKQLRNAEGHIPYVEIEDAPKFAWRGLHFDDSRHFFGKKTLIKFLRTMASFKLNVLHWHLVDNQGWRFPVPGYPQLVEAVRPVENRRNFCDLTKTGTYGPFGYTKEDIREIVAEAKKLHIRVIPEIEIPGHSEALIRMCPEFGCFTPSTRPEYFVNNAVCVGKAASIRFFEKVLDEVCELFPDAVIHIGGDECDRTNWKTCPDCQRRMKIEGLKDVAELQAWTTTHFERYLSLKGRRLMGWDEIAEGGLPPKAMVMSWRGTSTGIAAAKAGHEVVMTPNEFCYFDYGQGIVGDPNPYPYNWTVPVPLAKVYTFDPLKGIPERYSSFVMGAQGNNWSEMSCTGAVLEWKVWPRAAALAEVLWTYPRNRDFESFAERVEPLRAQLVKKGVNAAPVAVAPEGLPRGSFTSIYRADGETLRYECGKTVSELVLTNGVLEFFVNGKRVRKFEEATNPQTGAKRPFIEIETVRLGPASYLTIARRVDSDITASILYHGEEVTAKERYDTLPD